MARRIRWQILIAAVSSLLVLGLMGYLTLTATTVARPLAGGAYVEGLTSPPQQLNPLISNVTQDPSGADLQALLFEGLMRIGSDGLPEPAMAQVWETNEAGTVYTFTLRTGVIWHRSDIPLTADDVLFTVRSIQNPAFSGDPNIAQVWRNVLIDKVDDRTILCTLRSSLASFLSLATFPILPAHLLRDVSPSEWATVDFNQKPIGTGPYQIEELTAEHALLTANPHYYATKPFLDRIELRFFASPAAAHAALIRGEIKGVGFLSTSELGQINQPRNIARHTTPLDSYTILTFNLREGPL